MAPGRVLDYDATYDQVHDARVPMLEAVRDFSDDQVVVLPDVGNKPSVRLHPARQGGGKEGESNGAAMAFDPVHRAGGVVGGAVRDAGAAGCRRARQALADARLGRERGPSGRGRDRGVLPPGALGEDLQRLRAHHLRHHPGADSHRGARSSGRRPTWWRCAAPRTAPPSRRWLCCGGGRRVRRPRGRLGAQLHHGRAPRGTRCFGSSTCWATPARSAPAPWPSSWPRSATRRRRPASRPSPGPPSGP